MYIFDSDENNINELNNAMDKNVTVIFFLKDGCGYCEELKPTLSHIKNDLRSSNLNGVLASVKTNNLSNMKYKRDINGVPTISVFKDGKYNKEDYNGSRSYDDLKQFLLSVYKKNKLPSVSRNNSKSFWKEFNIPNESKTKSKTKSKKGKKKGKKKVKKGGKRRRTIRRKKRGGRRTRRTRRR